MTNKRLSKWISMIGAKKQSLPSIVRRSEDSSIVSRKDDDPVAWYEHTNQQNA